MVGNGSGEDGEGVLFHTPPSGIRNSDQWQSLISTIYKPVVNQRAFSEKLLEQVSPIKFISQGLSWA